MSQALQILQDEWETLQPGRYRTLTESDEDHAFYVGFEHAIEVLKTREKPDYSKEMLEVLREVALPPYPDSDLGSLLETLRVRAKSVLTLAAAPMTEPETSQSYYEKKLKKASDEATDTRGTE